MDQRIGFCWTNSAVHAEEPRDPVVLRMRLFVRSSGLADSAGSCNSVERSGQTAGAMPVAAAGL